MSVMEVSNNDFGELLSSLLYIPELRDRFYSDREKAFLAALGKFTNTPTDDEIKAFILRLIIANKVAYAVQYPESNKISFELPHMKELNGFPSSDKHLLRTIRHIHYNLYTNAGRIFLGHEDEERLKRYEHYLMDKLLEL